MKEKRKLTTPMAIFGFFAPLVVILTLISMGVSIMLGLTAAICVEGLFWDIPGASWRSML